MAVSVSTFVVRTLINPSGRSCLRRPRAWCRSDVGALDAEVELAKALAVLNAAYSLSGASLPPISRVSYPPSSSSVCYTEPALYASAGPEHFADLLPALNAANLRAAAIAGEIYVAEDREGRYLGVAIGFGPGREIFDW